ncbi:MAG TPA: hypothetical protein VH591_05630 [Ktedonobacterales bacterium]|jgi:hypothetical protein
MQQAMPWSRWRRWRQALRFGLPLALLELCVLISFYKDGNREILGTFSWELQATILSLLLYLVVATLAGYWFCRHGGQRGARAGLSAGLVGAIIVIIVMIPLFGLLYLRFVDMLRTCQLHACGPYGPADYLSILGSFFLTLALLNGAGILLSALGGWLGGIFANWRAMPRERVGEQQA